MAKGKDPKFFTLRNDKGQYIATYLACTAKQAVERYNREQAICASQFRGHRLPPSNLTAKVEDGPSP